MAQYIIGIDLGTTNCTMAYASLSDEDPSITQFSIPQIMELGLADETDSLPSFLYFPLKEELKGKQLCLAGEKKSREYCLGTYAKERGSEVPARVISSAKSWLCHDGIDRRQAILPLVSDDDDMKLSPVQVTTELLSYLAQQWESKMPNAPFQEQKILVTVPASFDPSARQLVQEAAEAADYPDMILLEEPQAAFYAWLDQEKEGWRDQLSVGDHVLVVDVGGGTTDFTLINVQDNDGDLSLERIAVGSHLLLGGDNMDLALAYQMKVLFEEDGHTIDDWQLQQLVHASRKAKETLLQEEAPEAVDITIHGRGSSLIASTITRAMTHDLVIKTLVDGFIPEVSATERSPKETRSGIQQLGLPYAQDPRISCQLAKFLSMTGENQTESMDTFIHPQLVLFNGGTLKAHALRERIVSLLNAWGTHPISVLNEPDFDHAVSRGAVYYGLAREGHGIRIKGGTSRSYFVAVEGAAPAVPGMPPPMHALCVVPFGMEEGGDSFVEAQEFSLVLGKKATFRFFANARPLLSDGSQVATGDVVRQWKTELSELHPIETVLKQEEEDGQTVCVTLESKVTELGVLELWCHAKDGRKWKLEFDIRDEQLITDSCDIN